MYHFPLCFSILSRSIFSLTFATILAVRFIHVSLDLPYNGWILRLLTSFGLQYIVCCLTVYSLAQSGLSLVITNELNPCTTLAFFFFATAFFAGIFLAYVSETLSNNDWLCWIRRFAGNMLVFGAKNVISAMVLVVSQIVLSSLVDFARFCPQPRLIMSRTCHLLCTSPSSPA